MLFNLIFSIAALLHDGSVMAWGHADGGDLSGVQQLLETGVTGLYRSWWGFAALKGDGSLVCWRDNIDYRVFNGVVAAADGNDNEGFFAVLGDGSIVALEPEQHLGLTVKVRYPVEELANNSIRVWKTAVASEVVRAAFQVHW